MAYTAKDASGTVIYLDGDGTGADAGNAITPNSTIIGAVNETAPVTDTANSGLNGRLQRIAQRITSLMALLPATLGQKAKAGSLAVTLASDQDALPVTQSGTWSVTNLSGTVSLPTGAATQATLASLDTKFPAQGQALSAASIPVVLPATQVTTLTPPAAITGFATEATLGTTNTEIGGLTETAPASDTASSGLNGRLQRVAQRLTSLIALVGEVQASPTANTVLDRLKAIATALAGTLTVATHAVTQSGTWATVATSRAAAATNVHAPAANTAAIITYTAAGAGIAHAVSGIAWSYSAAPTGGNLKVEDGSGVTVFSADITAAGPGFIPFQAPLKGSTNTAMIITLAAGGSGVTGKVNVLGKWTE